MVDAASAVDRFLVIAERGWYRGLKGLVLKAIRGERLAALYL